MKIEFSISIEGFEKVICKKVNLLTTEAHLSPYTQSYYPFNQWSIECSCLYSSIAKYESAYLYVYSLDAYL